MPALKDIMEGKPLRSPLHPALVHLPLALFPLSVIFDLASLITHTSGWPLPRAAFFCLVGGLASALVAAVFGLVDYTDIRDDHRAKKTATAHLILNLVAVGLFAAGAGLRYGSLAETRTPALPLVVSLLGLAVLSYGGYLGGVLVYDDGIAVGRHRRRTRTPATTLKFQSHGAAVAVANEGDLREGETLRVSINGTVATIVRAQGEVYAFQEFCSHRYGPLSEGEFSGCEVTCPWHGSRFDVRSGKVTGGPAKVDLRTFGVKVRDGKIWLEPPAAKTAD
jgi:nitrite reductase/ring-hydroxylating ferredoxin subunit/uncharacterized membrane protein